MTDAEYATQRDRTHALVTRWANALGLGWWEITNEWARDDYREKARSTNDGAVSLATCRPDWRYAHAAITWNMPEIAELSDAKPEAVVVHELQHVFLHEARWRDGDDTDSVDHEERVATTLAKAFLWLRDAVLADPKAWRPTKVRP